MSSVVSRHSGSFGGLQPSGLNGAELVDLDSLLDTCLEDAQPGILDLRCRSPYTEYGRKFAR